MSNDRILVGRGEAAMEIVRAFGFTTDDRIVALTFTLTAGQAAQLLVERFVKVADARRFASVVERYRLVPRFGDYERRPHERLDTFVTRMVDEAMARIGERISTMTCEA